MSKEVGAGGRFDIFLASEIDSPPPLFPSKENVRMAIDMNCLHSLFSQDGEEIRQKVLNITKVVEREFLTTWSQT